MFYLCPEFIVTVVFSLVPDELQSKTDVYKNNNNTDSSPPYSRKASFPPIIDNQGPPGEPPPIVSPHRPECVDAANSNAPLSSSHGGTTPHILAKQNIANIYKGQFRSDSNAISSAVCLVECKSNNQMLVSHNNGSFNNTIQCQLAEVEARDSVYAADRTNISAFSSAAIALSENQPKTRSSTVFTCSSSTISSHSFLSSSGVPESHANSSKVVKSPSHVSASVSSGHPPLCRSPVAASVSPTPIAHPTTFPDAARGPCTTYQIQAQVHSSPYQASLLAKTAAPGLTAHPSATHQSNFTVSSYENNTCASNRSAGGANQHCANATSGKMHSSQVMPHTASQGNSLYLTYQSATNAQTMPNQTQSLSSSQLSALAAHPAHQISLHSNPNLHSTCHSSSPSPAAHQPTALQTPAHNPSYNNPPSHNSCSYNPSSYNQSSHNPSSLSTSHPPALSTSPHSGLSTYPACSPYSQPSGSSLATGSSSTTLNGDLTPRGPCRGGDLGEERSPKSSVSHLSLLSASFPCRSVHVPHMVSAGSPACRLILIIHSSGTISSCW